MAGPTDPTDPAATATASLQDLSTASDQAQKSMNELSGLFGTVQNALSGLADRIGSAGISLQNMNGLTAKQALAFTGLTTALLGAKEAYTNFAGVDTSRLNTFTSQIQNLQEIFNRSPAFKLAKAQLDAVTEAASRVAGGATGALGSKMIKEAQEIFKRATQVVSDTTLELAKNADNATRLQNSFMQLTAQMGDSATLFGEISSGTRGVGSDLSNLNNITAKYSDVMTSAIQATGVGKETMYQYASQINQLPGGFKELMTSTEIAGQKTNLLTAAVKFATGSGRQFSEVVDDMKRAMLEYGVSGTDALKFTANITEVANTFHAQVKDVREALMHSADAFKFFAQGEDGARQMTQGMTESMNQYIGSLKNVGVPIQNALSMFQNYTDQVQKMSQAQTAFLSAQSGGPGGLRGGFQIDAMIKRGDFAGLQKKVEETIRKMTGPIISFEDAQRSESAASQYTRQIQILQQGPLGSMARTRAEAESLLEAMKKGTGIAAIKRPDEALKDSIDKGTKIEQLQLTKLNDINVNITRLQNQAGISGLRTIQGAFAARSGDGGGIGGTGAGINFAGQERLRAMQERGMHMEEGSPTQRALKEAGMSIKNLPDDISSAVGALKQNIGGGGAGFTTIEDYAPAGKQLGRNLPRTTTGTGAQHSGALGTATTTAGGAHAGQPVPVVLASGSAISVNFTGVCPHCGRDVHTTEVARTVSPQSLTGGGPGF